MVAFIIVFVFVFFAQWNTKTMWARTVWREGNKEIEEVIPSCWIKNDYVHWPHQGKKRALKTCKEPEDAWMQFPLIKIKIQSGM